MPSDWKSEGLHARTGADIANLGNGSDAEPCGNEVSAL